MSVTTRNIITRNIYPPIPDRRFDWVAYHDSEVECPWTYGYGRTEQEALDDLNRLDEERADYDEQLRYEYETRGQI